MAKLGEAITATPSLANVADDDAIVAAAVGLRLMGWAAMESDGTPALASGNIKNAATGAAGTVLVPFTLAASDSKGAWYGPNGLDAADGISLDWIEGTLDLVVFHQTITPG